MSVGEEQTEVSIIWCQWKAFEMRHCENVKPLYKWWKPVFTKQELRHKKKQQKNLQNM